MKVQGFAAESLRPSGYEPDDPPDFHLNLLRAAGLEPARTCVPQILSLVCLPNHHDQLINSVGCYLEYGEHFMIELFLDQ